MARTITTVEEFQSVHGVLLASAGLPTSLHPQLFHKLKGEVFDGGDFFQIEVCENGRQRRLVSSQTLLAHSQVFLIDHAWSFRLPDARNQLRQYPDLVDRLSAMMCILDDDAEEAEDSCGEKKRVEDVVLTAKVQAKEEGHALYWLDLDEVDMTDNDLKSLELTTECPDLVGLSLWGNKLSSEDDVLRTMARLPNLKALWLNGNPVVLKGGHEFETSSVSSLPQLELYNSKFTESYGKWAVAFCARIPSAKTPSIGDELKDVKSVDLSDRNARRLHPKVFNPWEMPLLNHFNLKGNPLDLESESNLFGILKSFPNLQSLEINIPGPLGNSGVEILERLPNLTVLNGIEATKYLEKGESVLLSDLEQRFPEWCPKEAVEERILRAMWAYVMTYRLCDEEKLDETPVWYIMDELGSALRHSDEPNFRVAPFMYMPDGMLQSAISYSLLWPIKDIHEGQECTRDFLSGFGEEKQRSARLTAWFHTPKDYFKKIFRETQRRLESAHVKVDIIEARPMQSAYGADSHALTVYTDLPQVQDTLHRPEFKFCDDPSTADILWTSTQIDDDLKRTLGLRDDQFVNQFPFEACLVMKHHLAKTIQQAYGAPSWFQTTYDMEKEMAAFIGDYFVREEEGRDNLWIMKPWNMARTIDTSITEYLPALIRLAETGPKICQKYVEHPALFQGKKFDLRYIVLVRSFKPIDIFLSDVFWTRISNNQYTLESSSLSDYETHFTVMNYGRKLVHVNTHDFIPAFEEEHKVKWKDVHQKVKQMLRSVFEGAFALHPEMHCPQACAIYGVDVLLTEEFAPKLLEVTYCPDCTRACKYDVRNVLGDGSLMKADEFFNDVFGCLFLNSQKNVSPL